LRRNEREARDESDQRIQLPFVVVQTGCDTVIQCQMTEDKYVPCCPSLFTASVLLLYLFKIGVLIGLTHDRSEYVFDFNKPFSIHDDVEVLKRLGLTLGLDDGSATPQVSFLFFFFLSCPLSLSPFFLCLFLSLCLLFLNQKLTLTLHFPDISFSLASPPLPFT
jgi:hypothetical protein